MQQDDFNDNPLPSFDLPSYDVEFHNSGDLTKEAVAEWCADNCSDLHLSFVWPSPD